MLVVIDEYFVSATHFQFWWTILIFVDQKWPRFSLTSWRSFLLVISILIPRFRLELLLSDILKSLFAVYRFIDFFFRRYVFLLTARFAERMFHIVRRQRRIVRKRSWRRGDLCYFEWIWNYGKMKCNFF